LVSVTDARLPQSNTGRNPSIVTDIPNKPWDVIAVDFSGPYPDGYCNLVAIDKRTRYPEVVKTHSTAFPPTKVKLKTMFATHGTPSQLESDNKPPFNSREFAEFSKTEGFYHDRVPQNMHVLMERRKAS